MTLARIVATLGFALGLAALVLQFGLTIPSSMDKGRSLFGSIVFYFSFFTILTNIGAVLVYLSELWDRPALRFFREPVHRAALAAAIAFVMIFYHLVLAKTWAPQGLFKLCDLTLHYVTPALFLIWWLGFAGHRHLDWNALPRMLAYPVLYVIWVMARGAVVHEYPYPVLEVQTLGYPAVAVNIAFLFVLFSLLCAVVITIDRWHPGKRSVPHH